MLTIIKATTVKHEEVFNYFIIFLHATARLLGEILLLDKSVDKNQMKIF